MVLLRAEPRRGLAERLAGRSPARAGRGARLLERQWSELHAQVEAGEITARPDGTIAVAVHQTVRELDGSLLSEGDVVHVYTFHDGLIARMDVEEPG